MEEHPEQRGHCRQIGGAAHRALCVILRHERRNVAVDVTAIKQKAVGHKHGVPKQDKDLSCVCVASSIASRRTTSRSKQASKLSCEVLGSLPTASILSLPCCPHGRSPTASQHLLQLLVYGAQQAQVSKLKAQGVGAAVVRCCEVGLGMGRAQVGRRVAALAR